ncbi:MAG: hypothetical protein QXG52_09220 [Candidatus Caldarchaeum sp.]
MNEVSVSTSKAGVRGSSGGSTVPPHSGAKLEKVYHEQNGELIEVDPLWENWEKIISSGRFQPTKISTDQYPYGRFEVAEYHFRVVTKLWHPNPGLAWSELIVYVQGGENDE